MNCGLVLWGQEDSYMVQDDQDRLINLAAERRRWLLDEIRDIEERQRALSEEMERRRTELGHLEGLLRMHDVEISKPAPLPVERNRGTYADMVVELLGEVGGPLHYREIERRLRAKGLYGGAGKDPANALLAYYFNDRRLYRPQRGTYALRKGQAAAQSVGTRRGAKKRQRSRKGA
jgi:hypothetical protein